MPERVAFYSLNRASIFAISRNGDELYGQLSGQRKVRLASAGDGNWSYPAATGQITFAMPEAPKPELTLNQNGRELRVARIADLDWQETVTASPQVEAYLGAYELNASHMLSVTREGNRLFVEESGQPKFEVAAFGVDAFSADNGRLVVFLRNEHGKVNQALIQEPAFGARLARWVKPERAKIIQEEFARRVAEVPDRFKDQAPQPGGKEAILRGIADMQRGAPNYERMSIARWRPRSAARHPRCRPSLPPSARSNRSSSAASAPRLRHLWRQIRQGLCRVSHSARGRRQGGRRHLPARRQ